MKHPPVRPDDHDLSHVSTRGIKPGTHWREARALTFDPAGQLDRDTQTLSLFKRKDDTETYTRVCRQADACTHTHIRTYMWNLI